MVTEAAASSAAVDAPPVDMKVWATFRQSFSQVQFLLDHNRLLIKEINQNQESKLPENLNRNLALIRELNANISKVVSIYGSLSTLFLKAFEESAENSANLLNVDMETVKSSNPEVQIKDGSV